MTDKIEVTETQILNNVKEGILVSRGRLRVTLVSRIIGSEQLVQRVFCKIFVIIEAHPDSKPAFSNYEPVLRKVCFQGDPSQRRSSD